MGYGGSCRPDIVYETPDGHFAILEVKTGDGPPTLRQSEIFPLIGNGDAIPTGDNAREFGLLVGIPLKDQGHPNGFEVITVVVPGLE